VSTPERPQIPAADLPARLSLALARELPEAALREALSGYPQPEAARERLLEEALSIGRRAREREPRASARELQLALGVLLTLHAAAAPAEPEASA
jgi:hypothetical protein